MAREPSWIETVQLPRSTIERASGPVRGLVLSIRVALGWIFLWAFLDKTFGLGFSTSAQDAWINGGSPTFGFLNFATRGPFADVFQAMAGHPVVDAVFMLGLLGVGISLTFGVAMRLGAVAGSLMLVLMWLATLPPQNNPIVDDHIVYALVLLALPLLRADEVYGLGRWWKDREIVRRVPILG